MNNKTSLFSGQPSPRLRHALHIIGGCILIALTGNQVFAAAPEIKFVAVAKFNHHRQSSHLSSPPALNDEFGIALSVETLETSNLSAVKVTLPNSNVLDFVKARESHGNYWGKATRYADFTHREELFPNGDYVFTFSTADNDDQSMTLSLAGNAIPTPPRVSNYQAAQAIDSDAPFLLTWDAFADAGPDDSLAVEIEGLPANWALEYRSKFLPTTATSMEIPAGMLTPGQVYDVSIVFLRIMGKNKTTLEDGLGLATYGSKTHLQIQTASDLGPGTGVKRYLVAKLKDHRQYNPLAPQKTASKDKDQGGLFLHATGPDTVLAASISWPNGEVYPMGKNRPEETTWGVDWEHFKPDPRDDLYPTGTYRLHIESADGTRIVPLTLIGGAYPAPPHVNNFAAAQVIDSTQGFTLSWDAFEGATIDDLVEIEITDESETPKRSWATRFSPAQPPRLIFQPNHSGRVGSITPLSFS